MMTIIPEASLSELDIVQNPAIGAFLTWHYTLGYQEGRSEDAPILLSFLVLPILLNRQSFNVVTSTRKTSGLLLFAVKFEKEREVLMELHSRALQLRQLSLQSLGVAATSRLIKIDYTNAALHGYPQNLLGFRTPTIPERLNGFAAAADKLGYWFSKLSAAQIASTLRIDF